MDKCIQRTFINKCDHSKWIIRNYHQGLLSQNSSFWPISNIHNIKRDRTLSIVNKCIKCVHIYPAIQLLSILPSIHHQLIHPSIHPSIAFYEALLLHYKDLNYRKIWSNRFLTKLSILSLSCRTLHTHSTLFAWTVFELSFKVRYKYWNPYADTLKQHVCPI